MQTKDLRNDPKTEVAPPLLNYLSNGESFKKLQEIQNNSDSNIYYNYILKCTDGIFIDKFLYINTTPDGELFGSGDPDELDLTMYIESANLSEKHAEIKFIDNCKYLLRDCNSETGTWVRVGHPCELSMSTSGGILGNDLYQESRLRMFKAGDYQFVFEEHQTQNFDEVASWLKGNYFINLIPIISQKLQIKSLQQMLQSVQRGDLQKFGVEDKETDRFMNLIDLMKRTSKINISQNGAQPKKLLVMKFIAGHIKKEIVLDPEQMPIVFGRTMQNVEAGQNGNFIELFGDKISNQHFEIDYDKIRGTVILRNCNLNTKESCGLYKMLFEHENHNLQPGDAFRIGTLEFLIERFNTGIVSDIGQRDHMEDYYQYVQQLINLDNRVQITYYAVFDGHGGSSCAQFCSENLHLELKHQLEDVIHGIENSEDLNNTVQDCIKRAFQITDEKYYKNFTNEAKQCGSTAVIVLLVGNKMYCANVGDARAIMCRQGEAIDLSVDHKAKRPDEQERIKSQGGYIVYGRVLGRLAISRAFGDYDCKNIEMPKKALADGQGDGQEIESEEKVIRNFIMSEPEIHVIDINPQTDDFFLLASDGLFDRFSSQECVSIVSKKLQMLPYMEQESQKVVQELVEQAKSKRMMTDNITVILVTLNRGIENK